MQRKREYCHETHNDDLKEKIEKETYSSIYSVAKQGLGARKKDLLN